MYLSQEERDFVSSMHKIAENQAKVAASLLEKMKENDSAEVVLLAEMAREHAVTTSLMAYAIELLVHIAAGTGMTYAAASDILTKLY